MMIWTILKSRFKKQTEEQWVLDRREMCAKCDYNTLNMEAVVLKTKILRSLSDFYSWVTKKGKEDNLGNCTACEVCSIYYKTNEETEECPKQKWRK